MNQFIQQIQQHPLLTNLSSDFKTLHASVDLILISNERVLYITTPTSSNYLTIGCDSRVIKAVGSVNSCHVAFQTLNSVCIVKLPTQFKSQNLIVKGLDLNIRGVVDIDWHMFSNCLIVLDKRSRVLLYNVDGNKIDKEFQFDALDPAFLLKFGAVSASINGIGTGWPSLSLFTIKTSGKLSLISPCLPSEFVIDESWIEDCLEITRASWKTDNEKICYWSVEFLESLRQQHQQLVTYPLPNIGVASVDVSNNLKRGAQDFVVIGAASILLFVVSHGNSIEILGCFETVLPTFQLVPNVLKSPALTMLCQLEFPQGRSKLVHSNLLQDTVFVVFENSVYQVQLDFLQQLQGVEDDFQLKNPIVKQIIATKDKIFGFELLEYKFDLVYVCLVGSELVLEPVFRLSSEQLQPQSQTKIKDEDVVSTFRPFEANLKARQVKSNVDLNFKYPDVDELGLKAALKEFNSTTIALEDITTKFCKLKTHIEYQKQEQQVQQDLVNEIKQTLNELEPSIIGNRKKIAKQQEKMKKLKTKVTTILEVLFDLSQPRLSAQELVWFQELSNMDQDIVDLSQKLSRVWRVYLGNSGMERNRN